MTDAAAATKPRASVVHRWIRRGFLLWALVSTSWLANSIRTRGVDDDTLRSSPAVAVEDQATTLAFLPASTDGKTALIFICGSGISAYAYAPLLRPIAEVGYPVFVVKLPYRFAPFESHKQAAVNRARDVISAHPEVSHWVISGHSLGGALAARMARADARALSAMVLIGTTHPKQDDLSFLQIPVTKVYASNDGIAPPDRVLSNQGLLPKQTRWVEIKGGNHSQFGRYGHQLFDGTATIRREEQERITRAAIVEAIAGVASGRPRGRAGN
jgi:pimeloyl-ACP methyl ester carboxylesterase